MPANGRSQMNLLEKSLTLENRPAERALAFLKHYPSLWSEHTPETDDIQTQYHFSSLSCMKYIFSMVGEEKEQQCISHLNSFVLLLHAECIAKSWLTVQLMKGCECQRTGIQIHSETTWMVIKICFCMFYFEKEFLQTWAASMMKFRSASRSQVVRKTSRSPSDVF